MSDDIQIENAKKNLSRVFSEYEKEIAEAAKELDYGVKELEKLGVKDPLNNLKELARDKDKNKKKYAECILKAREKADNAAASLQTNLAVLKLTPGVPEDALKQFLDWLKKSIEDRSVKLGKNVSLKFQPRFNKKGTELEEAGLELIWKFKKF